MKTRKIDTVFLCVAILFGFSMILFFASYCYLGGSAVGGKIESGHYYVEDKGRFTEVSRTAFTYIRWLENIYFINLFLLAFVGLPWWYLHSKSDTQQSNPADGIRGKPRPRG